MIDDLEKLISEIQFSNQELQSYLNKNGSQSIAQAIIDDKSRAEFLQMGLSEGAYFELRINLNGKLVGTNGRIVAKQGARGGLRVVRSEDVAVPEVKLADARDEIEKAKESELKYERDYYPLVQKWATDEGWVNTIILGGKLPGFSWENPDLISADFWTDKISTTLGFEFTTYEVKLSVHPSAVWQAAHYSLFSHRVYLAFVANESAIRNTDEGRVFDLAVSHGLGVLAFDGRAFKEIQSPRSFSPPNFRTAELISRLQNYSETNNILNKAKQQHDKLICSILAQKLKADYD